MTKKTTLQFDRLKATCADPVKETGLDTTEKSLERILSTFVDPFKDLEQPQFDEGATNDAISAIRENVPFFSLPEWIYLFFLISEQHPFLDQCIKRGILALQEQHGDRCVAKASEAHSLITMESYGAAYLIARKFGLEGIYTLDQLRRLIGEFAGIDRKFVFDSDFERAGMAAGWNRA